jgi:type IV pilus assembly protein PilO
MSVLADFRNLDVNRIGSWPATVKYTFAGLLFALTLLGVWWFKVRDQQETLRTEEVKEASLFATFEQKQAKVANLEALKAQLDEMKEILRQMLRQLPSKTEMPDLLVDISQTALSTGIDNQKFQPGAETKKEFYAEKPIALRMVGTYHQFGSFVSGVASLPRVVILTMHDISLRPQAAAKGAAQAAGNLVLEGTVKTYRYVEEGEDDAAAAGAKKAVPPPKKPTPPPAAKGKPAGDAG